jgi:hypothetical protein
VASLRKKTVYLHQKSNEYLSGAFTPTLHRALKSKIGYLLSEDAISEAGYE